MARYSRLDVYNHLLASGLAPLFYNADPAVAQEVLLACAEGGARFLELTNRGEQAIRVFSHLSAFIEKEKLPLILGVGSVMDAPTAAIFIAHGANFVVSPVLNAEIVRLCNRRKIACIPGCGSVSEISEAEELGAEIVKIFPGDGLGGPGFVKAVMGPMPWARLMPTGGVDSSRESVQGWIKAGAACLGMGSKLIRKDWVAARNYAAIRDTVGQVLAWIEEARV